MLNHFQIVITQTKNGTAVISSQWCGKKKKTHLTSDCEKGCNLSMFLDIKFQESNASLTNENFNENVNII